MRSKLAIAVALCLALVVPAGASAGPPSSVGHSDGAIATYTNGTDCVVISYMTGPQVDVGTGGRWISTGLSALLAAYDSEHEYCLAPTAFVAPDGDFDALVIPLTAAYVAATFKSLGSYSTIKVDLAWVATGPAVQYMNSGEGSSVVGKDAPAHVTGSVFVDGTAWDLEQPGTLRSLAVSKETF